MLPRLTPLNTRPTISPVASRLSIARSDSSASARTSLSGSAKSAPFFSSSGRSSVLVFGSRDSASARIAPRRVGLSLLASCTVACVSVSSALISASCSFASARWITGSMSSSAPRCSACAAARRVARSVATSCSAAMPVASSRRTRLLSTTSSRDSGSGSTLAPVARSIAAPSLTRSTVSPAVCTSPFSSDCSSGNAPASPEATSAAIALTFSSFSPSARSCTSSGASACAGSARSAAQHEIARIAATRRARARISVHGSRSTVDARQTKRRQRVIMNRRRRAA